MIDDMDRNGLAAEYVLGTLDDDERRQADAFRRSEPMFARLVDDWSHRFGELDALTADVRPPDQLLRSIMARIAVGQRVDTQGRGESEVIQLRRKVAVWRSAAAAGLALAASLALWIAIGPNTLPDGHAGRYMAVLQQGDGNPAFLVSLDLDQKRMTVVPSATPEQTGHSYELWMIAPGPGQPRSLGLIDADATAHPHLPAVDPALISKATFAVTLEPVGGSPTGQPTSTPVFAGRLVTTQP